VIIGGNSRIGVLGGIGPEATAEFYSRLIKRLQERGFIKSNTDFPQILINSIPAPELIHEDISEQELEPYIRGLKELDKFKVDFIVMVCNTIHLYYDRLQKEIKTPIIDLRHEIKQALKKKGIRYVLILGTASTIKQGLYRFRDIKSFEPSKKEIKQLTDAIFNFNTGLHKELQTQKVLKICKKYQIEGAESIILGCTEFAVMLKSKHISKIDTIDILIEAAISRCLL